MGGYQSHILKKVAKANGQQFIDDFSKCVYFSVFLNKNKLIMLVEAEEVLKVAQHSKLLYQIVHEDKDELRTMIIE